MKKTLLLLTSSLLLSSSLYASSHFEVSSKDIRPNTTIAQKFEFNGFGCTGENQSPELSWKNAPKGTKSFAVSVYDPDAPTGSGFWHWYVVNIPATVSKLSHNAGAENSTTLPKGAFQLRNDYGYHGWGGVCPPKGDKAHRYIFTVHALKTEHLDVNQQTPTALAGFLVHANTLATASFTAKYGR
ncbi:phosphatidylethanolamine-binding protein [Mergibacter septicus]|uniref:Phosphatidylethanolamine-binding protein n=1 Tax=Mergibacter septicus TaxID=221402 RepID=A0A8E3MFN5_9PAST|nr:YbhB/YbcL family Raf kinase inhibitor-like protein [Mergibacter septicus]AWX13142.1 phosphatidylethanolamine-binding protein [Mergibacter septicus]AWX15044.1 phosphatidylethanolamine-binding protein [Mergibacter septicus]QDJ12561.1 phosphatidylethanolamine-binding protein [Mergibacter septicus]QDJ14296.1 phosphatidylethanolamine-binding protein [Mergibacter septicus]UTU48263.1 YbhB/YbcL family Raf kinase inhibitor-like protein [Mergibacter septicus]